MQRLLIASLAVAVLSSFAVVVPVIAGEDLDSCGAFTLDELPRAGKQGNWNHAPYQRRHNRFLETHADDFASGFLSGKHFYVGFTRDVCQHLRKFRKGLPQKWRVRAFEANFSYKRLKRAHRCVRDMMGDDHLRISAVGTDVQRNKVLVMLERNTEGRRRAIRAECGARKARILRFTEGTVVPD